MNIEIMVQQYFVIEHKTYEICDSPCIGASQTRDEGTQKYGPFSHAAALRNKKEILNQRKNEGWNATMDDKNHLMKGDYDLWYSIKRETLQKILLDDLEPKQQKKIRQALQ